MVGTRRSRAQTGGSGNTGQEGATPGNGGSTRGSTGTSVARVTRSTSSTSRANFQTPSNLTQASNLQNNDLSHQLNVRRQSLRLPRGDVASVHQLGPLLAEEEEEEEQQDNEVLQLPPPPPQEEEEEQQHDVAVDALFALHDQQPPQEEDPPPQQPQRQQGVADILAAAGPDAPQHRCRSLDLICASCSATLSGTAPVLQCTMGACNNKVLYCSRLCFDGHHRCSPVPPVEYQAYEYVFNDINIPFDEVNDASDPKDSITLEGLNFLDPVMRERKLNGQSRQASTCLQFITL